MNLLPAVSMQINRVAQQGGRQRADIAPEVISGRLHNPEAPARWRCVTAPTPTWRNNQHVLGLRERCEREPQLLNWRSRRAAWR